MMPTVTVDVIRDGERETVQNVVLDRPTINAITDADQPEGAISCIDLGFPKTYAGNLRGASVEYGGRVYQVAGNPMHAPAAPGTWDMICRAYEVITEYGATVLFQKHARTTDALGISTYTWADAFTSDCIASEVTGTTSTTGGAEHASKTLEFTVPWSDDVAAMNPSAVGWRAIWEGHAYRVTNVENVGFDGTRGVIKAVSADE